MLPRVGTTRQIRTNVLHLKRKASVFDQEIGIGCDNPLCWVTVQKFTDMLLRAALSPFFSKDGRSHDVIQS